MLLALKQHNIDVFLSKYSSYFYALIRTRENDA